jgi:DNA-binding PadR family transcriptional regulator
MFGPRASHRERYFHGPWRQSPFHKGDLKYVILNLLKEKPRYGYEVIRELEEYSYGFYKPSPGVVYPTLQMLEEMEYTTSEETDGKKVYAITEKGIQFLNERKDTAEEVRSRMCHHWDNEYFDTFGETIGEFRELGKFMKRRARNISPEKMQRIRDIISRSLKEIESIIKE